MADTIITNTPERQDSGALGLVIALIIAAAIIAAGVIWYRHGAPGVPNTGSTNINVTLPSNSGSSGDTGSSAGGSAAQ